MRVIREKYKLVLSWDRIDVVDDNLAVLHGARFSGPALLEAAKLQDSDSIDIDLTSQHVDLIGTWNVVTFSWSGVNYSGDGTVVFSHATLRSPEIGKVRGFSNTDRFVINTEDHEESKHPFVFVYTAYIEGADSQPYNYKRQ